MLTHIVFCSVSAISPNSDEFLDVLSARIDQLAVSYSEPGLWKFAFIIVHFATVDWHVLQKRCSEKFLRTAFL